jgi:hypothetical protein
MTILDIENLLFSYEKYLTPLHSFQTARGTVRNSQPD